MGIDLKAMNRKDLEKLLGDVEKALRTAKNKDRRDAKKAAERAAQEFGFSLTDLSDIEKPTSKPLKKKKKASVKKAPPKYANPADPSQTWTGKGRQPNWYRAEIAKGTAPQKMEL